MNNYSYLQRTIIALVIILACPFNGMCQGVNITGAGSINRSMAGVGVATGIDAVGSLLTNPASISQLQESEIEVGLEVVWMNTKLGSSIGGNGGEVDSHTDELYIPSIGVVWKDPGSDLTYGIGAYGIGGFTADYDASLSSPISAPPQFGGLGPILGRARIFQVAPSVAYDITKNFTIGIGPTLTIAQVKIEPLLLGPVDSNGTYGADVDDSSTYGGGFQVGAIWRFDEDLRFGASFKSPQWFEDFEYESTNSLGTAYQEDVDIEYPLITSIGAAYGGIKNLTLGLDVKYFGYGQADGFQDSGFREDGSSRGLGWDDVYAISAAAEYHIAPEFALRVGYSFNQNPISSDVVGYNLSTPLIQKHNIAAGISYDLCENVILSLAAVYVPSESLSGNIQTPLGPIPGSKASIEIDYAFSVLTGLQYRF